MAWVWIDAPSDGPNDKTTLFMIQRFLVNIKNGYKEEKDDFYTLAQYIDSVFDTNKTIDDIASVKGKK